MREIVINLKSQQASTVTTPSTPKELVVKQQTSATAGGKVTPAGPPGPKGDKGDPGDGVTDWSTIDW